MLSLFASLAAAAFVQSACQVEVVVLGAGQDAGAPQIGHPEDPAWKDPSLTLLPTSLGLVDHRSRRRYLFEPTPAITEQLEILDRFAPGSSGVLGLEGVFMTHAHIGHYTGLMYLGREAAGTSGVLVYAMPRMRNYLAENGPWSQLIGLGNIALGELEDRRRTELGGGIAVTPLLVPHRDEFSETAAFLISAGDARVLFAPDIDSWDAWLEASGIEIAKLVAGLDAAFIDASFFDNGELPGRDMTEIPHPRVAATMERMKDLPPETRARVHFIHYNHTNPIRFPDSEETAAVNAAGFTVARRGDRLCLVGGDEGSR